MSAVPNRPLRAFNARKNPGVADGDTKSAPVGFPAQRTNVESAGPGQTSSSGVTLTAVSYLGSGQVGWARGTELQPPQSMVISASESKTANETVRNHAHWPGHALLGNYGMMTSDQSPICDEHSKHHDDHWQPGRLCQMPTSGESESCDPDSSCQPTQQY